MSQMIEGPRKTYLAAAAIGANLRFKITDGTTKPPTVNVAGAADQAIGVTEAAVLAAGPFAGLLANAQGTRKMHATGAITSGNAVYAAAAGKVASSGSVIEGYAQETTTATGDIFEVLAATLITPTGVAITKIGTMVENATNTIHTVTIPIPAGSTLINIQVVNTVLWTATSASLIIGDDDDPNGYFEATDCKATDLLVGEVLDISQAENWGGNNGAYLVAATGRKGSAAASNSGVYYGAANNVIGIMTVGTPATTAGRTFIAVTYCVGDTIAAVATGP